ANAAHEPDESEDRTSRDDRPRIDEPRNDPAREARLREDRLELRSLLLRDRLRRVLHAPVRVVRRAERLLERGEHRIADAPLRRRRDVEPRAVALQPTERDRRPDERLRDA